MLILEALSKCSAVFSGSGVHIGGFSLTRRCRKEPTGAAERAKKGLARHQKEAFSKHDSLQSPPEQSMSVESDRPHQTSLKPTIRTRQ